MIQVNKIEYKTKLDGEQKSIRCSIMEQKETVFGMKDESCGRYIEFAGLCRCVFDCVEWKIKICLPLDCITLNILVIWCGKIALTPSTFSMKMNSNWSFVEPILDYHKT